VSQPNMSVYNSVISEMIYGGKFNYKVGLYSRSQGFQAIVVRCGYKTFRIIRLNHLKATTRSNKPLVTFVHCLVLVGSRNRIWARFHNQT